MIYEKAKAGILADYDSCPPPCTTFSAQGKFMFATTGESPSKVKLAFLEDVPVETIVFAYGFDALLVEIGSSLGLWLGLSVFGLFDIVVPMLNKARNLV